MIGTAEEWNFDLENCLYTRFSCCEPFVVWLESLSPKASNYIEHSRWSPNTPFPGLCSYVGGSVLRTAKPKPWGRRSCRERRWNGLIAPNAGAPPPLSESASDQ